MAQSAVRIVLNVVDKYSNTLMGLNQGLELISKSFGLVESAAKTAFSVLESGVNLAVVGGRFEEIHNQFSNLADSMGVNGAKIVREVREVSQQTITEYEAVGIASKALAARMTGSDLKTILDFTKRYTESTGESFTQMSQRIFVAIASGRTSTLKQMGLVLKTSATMKDVVKAAADQLKKFGDAGFNAADKVDALSAAQDDFVRKIGQAINNTPKFREMLGGLAEQARNFVDAFDPSDFVPFIDIILDNIQRMYEYIVSSGETVLRWLLNTDKPIEVTAGNFVDLVNKTVKASVVLVADGINNVLTLIQSINSGNMISGIVDNAVQLFSWGTSTIFKLARISAYGILKLVDNVIVSIEKMVAKFRNLEPLLKKVGVNINVNSWIKSMDAVGDTIQDTMKSVSTMGQDLESGLESISGASEKIFSGANDKIESLKINTNAISEYFDATAKNTTKLKENIAKMPDFDYSKLTKKAEKAIEKTVKSTKKLELSSKDLGKQYKNAFDIAQQEYDRLSKKLSLGFDVSGRKLTIFEQRDLERQLEELRKKLTAGLKTKGQLEIEYKTKNEAIKEMIKNVGGVNWPSAWKKMADAFMEMLIAAAAGENIPLAITNYTAV